MRRVVRESWYPPRCQSPHVPVPSSHCERLVWTPPREGEGAGRSIRWTCDCRSPVYELVQLGGLQFIRRTRRTVIGGSVAEESPRWVAKVAGDQWSALLSGHVR